MLPFPSEDFASALALYLNTKYGENYLIFNISEHPYDSAIFSSQVADYTFPGYPCPPLEALFLLCHELDSWIISDKSHIGIIHCQATRSRSLLIAALYMCYCKLKHKHPADALVELCEVLYCKV